MTASTQAVELQFFVNKTAEEAKGPAAACSKFAVVASEVADLIALAPLYGSIDASTDRNIDGKIQKQLDLIANEKFIAALRNTFVAITVSAELNEPLVAKEVTPIVAAGGDMRQTFGVPVEEIVRGIKHGVRKVNIDTDCRLAMTGEFRRIAKEFPGEFDPRKFLKPAMDKMRAICKQRFEEFGTAGNASKIKVLPMSAMAKRYASGGLDPIVETGCTEARSAAE